MYILCDIITASQPLLKVGIDHQKYSCIFAFFLYNRVHTILFSLLIYSYALLFYPSAPDISYISSHLQTGCRQCYKHQPFYSNLISYLAEINYCQFCNLNITLQFVRTWVYLPPNLSSIFCTSPLKNSLWFLSISGLLIKTWCKCLKLILSQACYL